MTQPQRRAQSAAAAAALPIVERLIATIEAENRDLEQGRPAQVRGLQSAQEPGPARAQPPRSGAGRSDRGRPVARGAGRSARQARDQSPGARRSSSRPARRSRRSSPAPSRTASPTEPIPRSPGDGRENDQGRAHRPRGDGRRDRRRRWEPTRFSPCARRTRPRRSPGRPKRARRMRSTSLASRTA